MTEKEIKSRYKKAFFGFIWFFLNPTLQVIIMGVIFSLFIKIPNYFIFLFSGLLPWNFFSTTINRATPSFVYERSLIQKANFPLEIIPLSLVISNFVHLLTALLIFIPLLYLTNGLFLQNMIFIFPALIWLLIFTSSLSLIFSTLNVTYRDVNFFVQNSLILLFYGSPILYETSSIPLNLRYLFYLNPCSGIFELFHYSIVKNFRLDSGLIISNLLLTILIFFISILLFKKRSKYFIDSL